MRRLTLLLLLVSLATCAVTSAPSEPIRHESPVVRIRFTARRSAGERLEVLGSKGSGFLVGDRGFVVTNHHVVDLRGYRDATYAVVVDEGSPRERTYAARLAYFDVGGDLAVLQIDAEDAHVPALALGPTAATGTAVRAVGYPTGQPLTESAGTVTRTLPPGLFRIAMVEADCGVQLGSSGGPLLDPRGRVVGVVARSNGRVLHAVPVDYLRRRLRQWRVGH